MKGVFPIDKFRNIETPFYYYDTSLLRKTLDKIKQETSLYSNYHVHYAVKANANNRILSIIRETGFGADCVSGGEIKAALEAGFPAHKIVFAVDKGFGQYCIFWRSRCINREWHT